MQTKSQPIVIDGRAGEGGGQILRTSLGLAAALGQPVRVEHVRGGRKKPGLMRQHLTAVRAAAEISGGRAEGASLGSRAVELWPGEVRAGDYRFGIGSAGSTLLVLQTILPPLLLADGPSTIELEGGTHNPWAPPFDFLAHSLAPLLEQAGARVELELDRPGFYPAGGGKVRARIEPRSDQRPLELLQRGEPGHHSLEIGLAHLPQGIAETEWKAAQKRLHWPNERCTVRDMNDSPGPGNVLSARLEFEHVSTVLSGFGEKGVSAERVGKRLGRAVELYLAADAPACEHLADQLMLPLALLAGGRYRATSISQHARTNADVINAFAPGTVTIEGDMVSVRPMA